MLVSNSRNSTLAASISPLPRTPAPSVAVPPPPPAVAGPQYTTSVAASAHGSAPDPVGGPALLSTPRSTAADALTKTALMMNILSKNDSSKNNHAYSLDAIRGMRDQLSSLEKPILASVQLERPGAFEAMKNLFGLQITTKTTKWKHAEFLIKIWLIFREIPSLVDGSFVGRFTRRSNELNHDLDTYIGVMTDIEELADEELGRKINSIRSIKSLPFPAGEKERKYLSPGLPVNTTEFPYCAACGHNFIDHPPSNATAGAENEEMQREYLETMAKITAWRANKKGLPQPACPKTGKLLMKISPPELMKKHIRCHCSKLRANWRTGTICPNNCEGYTNGKCPVCRCTCSLYVTVDMYHEIFILASMSKDGAAEMDPEDDAQQYIAKSLGVGAMQRQISAEKYGKMLANGEMQMQPGGSAFMSNVVDAGALAQGLFIVGHAPSQSATTFLRNKVRHVAHPSGTTCINLCGETIDLRTHGKSTSSNAAGKRIWNNGLVGKVQSTSVALDVDDNSSEDESPQFVGEKTRAAPTGKVVDDDLVYKLGRVRKRAGELAFSSDSSPGTAAKASEVYKRIVAGNDLITSICRDFPEKLSQEVVTMSMTMMTPPEMKKR